MEVDLTTVEYLGQIERLETMIQNKEMEIHRLENMARGLSSPSLGDKIQTSSSKDKLGDTVAMMEDEIARLTDLIAYYLELRARIIQQIDDMESNVYYQVLSLRFVQKKSYDEISTAINRTKRQAIRQTEDAITEFEKIYSKYYKHSKSYIIRKKVS